MVKATRTKKINWSNIVYYVHISITQVRAYSFTDFFVSVVVVMLHELGINEVLGFEFAKAYQSCKASNHRHRLSELKICLGISGSRGFVPHHLPWSFYTLWLSF